MFNKGDIIKKEGIINHTRIIIGVDYDKKEYIAILKEKFKGLDINIYKSYIALYWDFNYINSAYKRVGSLSTIRKLR